MKRFFAAIAALGFLAMAVPAIAQDRHDRDHDRGRPEFHHAPPPRHYVPPPRRYVVYHENQVWNGHHIHNHGGHWGYYQPRNGVQVFINIPL